MTAYGRHGTNGKLEPNACLLPHLLTERCDSAFESSRNVRLCRRGAERQRERRMDFMSAASAPLPLCGKPSVLRLVTPELSFANRGRTCEVLSFGRGMFQKSYSLPTPSGLSSGRRGFIQRGRMTGCCQSFQKASVCSRWGRISMTMGMGSRSARSSASLVWRYSMPQSSAQGAKLRA